MLFPPKEADINPYLTTAMLAIEFHLLIRYVRAMEKGDSMVLAPLKTKAWKEECQSLVDYLNRSKDMISAIKSNLETPGLSNQDQKSIRKKRGVQQNLETKLKDGRL